MDEETFLMTGTDPLVCIIVLNFNGKKHLEYCLPSILKTDYPNYKVLLVDNASSDESLEYVKINFPQIEIVASPQNLGWAGGNNLGIRHAEKYNADIVCLANNDIHVHPLWVRSAVDALISEDAIKFAGCNVFGAVKSEPFEDYEKARDTFSEIEYTLTDDFIDGMALFVKTEVFKNIGDIDERYFIYAEETDLQIRGEKAGYKKIRTNVPIWHYSSGTMRNVKIKSAYFAIRNTIRLAIKHHKWQDAVKKTLYIYKISCNPFFKGDMENVTIARLRPQNVIFNFCLVSYCVAWNILQLPKTYKRRKHEYELIAKSVTN